MSHISDLLLLSTFLFFIPTPIVQHVLCFAVSSDVVKEVVLRQKCHRGKVTGKREKKIKRALRTIVLGRVQELPHSRQVVMVSFLLICSLLPRLRKAG